MSRPAVVHVVEHWGRPSERFVFDTIRSTTATRAVVAAHRVVRHSPAQTWTGRRWDLGRCRDAAAADPALDVAPPGWGSLLFRRLPVRRALVGIAVIERADVLHAHFGSAAPDVWRAARRSHRPFAVSLHGWDLLVGARNNPAVVDPLRAADLVVVPSRFLADAAVARGVPAAVVRVVPSGLDLTELPFRERQPVALPTVTFAGRFVPKKGVLDVAHALAQVRRQTPIRARFVGYGPLEADLRALLRDLGLDAEVVDGRQPGAVRMAWQETDLAVTASRTAADGDAETLGLANLEALACGVPLVTTRHGGIPEAVTPDAALLVPTDGDIAGHLAEALGQLLDDPSRWAAMGRAGRAHVARHFDLRSQTAVLERMWSALAAGSPELPPA